MCLSTMAFTQISTSRYQTTSDLPTNTERYGIDYCLKNYTFNNADSSILETIPLHEYEHLRSNDTDVEIFDPVSGQTLILFFEKRTKSATDKLQNR